MDHQQIKLISHDKENISSPSVNNILLNSNQISLDPSKNPNPKTKSLTSIPVKRTPSQQNQIQSILCLKYMFKRNERSAQLVKNISENFARCLSVENIAQKFFEVELLKKLTIKPECKIYLEEYFATVLKLNNNSLDDNLFNLTQIDISKIKINNPVSL
jgi:hypothetical protein